MAKLIVIPNRSNYVLAWCLEYALYLRRNGTHVDILDVSRFSSRYIEKSNRWLIDNLSTKYLSSRGRFLKRFSLENGFELLKSSSGTNICSFCGPLSSAGDVYFQTALRSSYSRWFGSSEITVDDIPLNIVKAEKIAFMSVLCAVKSQLMTARYDEVITVNGRFVPDAASILAAIDAEVDFKMLEKMTEDWSHFVPFRISAQSLPERDQIIAEQWDDPAKGDKESKTEIAIEYLKLRTSPEWIWQSAKETALETKFDLTKPTVVFYLTSDYEFPVFGEVESDLHLSQEQAVRKIADICRRRHLSLLIKGHPHPGEGRLSVIEDKKWRKVASEIGATYLPCDSGEKSMELAAKSFCNVVHGSTLAVDFVVNNLPVIATTATDYTSLIPEICAFSEREMEKLLVNPPRVSDYERLFPWAYAAVKSGIPMSNFRITDDMHVIFDSKYIDEPRQAIINIRKIFARLLKRSGHGLTEPSSA